MMNTKQRMRALRKLKMMGLDLEFLKHSGYKRTRRTKSQEHKITGTP